MGLVVRCWTSQIYGGDGGGGGGGGGFGYVRSIFPATLKSRFPLFIADCKRVKPVAGLAESQAKKTSSKIIIRSEPSLMPPPAWDESGGDLVYQMYSLSEKKVISLNKSRWSEKKVIIGEPESESKNYPFPFKLVGSSHGWLALFNPRNNDLFLTNPLTGASIELPPLDKLPYPRFNLIGGRGIVSKVSLSCSPEKPECRAMMTFGPADRLAFCVPGHSREWTPIGDLFFIEEMYSPTGSYMDYTARVYEDLVHRRNGVFTCVTGLLEYEMEGLMDVDIKCIPMREDWDITNPRSPEIVFRDEVVATGDNYGRTPSWFRDEVAAFGGNYGRTPSWLFDNKEFLEKQCIQIPQLVYSEELDRLFLVVRFVLPRVGPNGEPEGRFPLDDVVVGEEVSMRGLLDIYPRKTVNFLVLEPGKGGIMRIVHSLDGLAMFVGGGDASVVSTSEFPLLKPNCIYFTDAKRYSRSPFQRPSFGNHDVGIFDYAKKTVSPIQVFKGIESPIVWFTPSHAFC